MSLLGSRLRELRIHYNRTLKDVSKETGLSVSFLSLVERDKVSISVDNLERLANYYKVRLMHLFQSVEDSSVHITHTYARLNGSQKADTEPASAFMLLSDRSSTRMESLLVCLAPGQGDTEFRYHEGDIFIFVLEGKVQLISERGEIEYLSTCDAAYYFGYPGRKIVNSSKEEEAVVVMVVAPPACLRDDAVDGYQGLLSHPVSHD